MVVFNAQERIGILQDHLFLWEESTWELGHFYCFTSLGLHIRQFLEQDILKCFPFLISHRSRGLISANFKFIVFIFIMLRDLVWRSWSWHDFKGVVVLRPKNTGLKLLNHIGIKRLIRCGNELIILLHLNNNKNNGLSQLVVRCVAQTCNREKWWLATQLRCRLTARLCSLLRLPSILKTVRAFVK